jgi:hypothetical protein
MFKVEPINVGDQPNDGDLFTITASRKELQLLFDFLRSDDAFYAEGRSSVDFVVNSLTKEIAR